MRQLNYNLLVSSREGSVETYSIDQGHVTVGRSPDATISLVEEGVSRQHCMISMSGGRLTVVDQGSTNGTRLNGTKITQAWLSHGDVIQVGSTMLRVRAQTTRAFKFFEKSSEGLPLRQPPKVSDQLSLTQDFISRVSLAETIDGIADVLLECAMETFPVERGFVLLKRPGSEGRGKIAAVRGFEFERAAAIGAGRGIVQRVLGSGRPEKEGSLPTDTKPAEDLWQQTESSQQIVCAPLRSGAAVLGVLYLDSEALPRWVVSGEMLTFLTSLAEVAAVNMERMPFGGSIGVSNLSDDEAEREKLRMNLEALVRERTEMMEEHEVELAARLNELEHLQKARATPVESMAHDIKNLVSALRCNLTVAESELPPESEAALALSDANICAVRIESMALDVLDVERMEDGAFPLNNKPTDVLRLISEAIRRHSKSAAEESLHLKISDDAEGITVILDGEMIARVLDNLIDNALNFTSLNGTIEVSSQRVGSVAQITVRDTGPGVAPEDRHRIFDQWFQADAKSSRHYGIGLYFCRLAVESHGGTIRVEGGSGDNRFIVTLPGVLEYSDSKEMTGEFDLNAEKK